MKRSVLLVLVSLVVLPCLVCADVSYEVDGRTHLIYSAAIDRMNHIIFGSCKKDQPPTRDNCGSHQHDENTNVHYQYRDDPAL